MTKRSMPGDDRPAPSAAERNAGGPRALSPSLDLPALRRRLRDTRGAEYWRSLEEVADGAEFQALLESEFPRQASVWGDGVDRRRFLQLAAASLAFGGLAACTRQPIERIVPYVRQPEEIVPGKPLFFATAATHWEGYAQGVLAESHEGRPTKLEGNPDHPASRGGTDAFAQATVLDLYDPDRSQSIRRLRQTQTWNDFANEIGGVLAAQEGIGGAGLRILTRTITSPTLAAVLGAVLAKLPRAKWHQYEPAGRNNARLGGQRAFGRFVETRFDFSRADVVLALDSEFLATGPDNVRSAHAFGARRKVRGGKGAMNRLYAVETSPTLTGTLADHRLALAPSSFGLFVAALAAALGLGPAPAAALAGDLPRWVRAIAADLSRAGARSAVVAGDYAPPEAHVVAHALNHALGNVGTTVLYNEPAEAAPVDHFASLAELVADVAAGSVDTLLILDGNPVFDAPADLEFAKTISAVGQRIHVGLAENETSEYCHWHVPMTHDLEAWGDARAVDGTATIIQPLIEPLYDGHAPCEVLALFLGRRDAKSYDLVRETWKARSDAVDFESFWRQAVHDGVVAGTAAATITPSLEATAVGAALAALSSPSDRPAGIELVFRPDPTIWDGRWANNPWLQELPKPFSRITWDNAVYVAPALAEHLGLADQQMVEVTNAAGRALELPVWIVPGHPDGAATVLFGGGRRRVGRVGTGTGFDVYPLRTSDAPWAAPGATLRPTARTHLLASTQNHHLIEGQLESAQEKARSVLQTATLADYAAYPDFAHEGIEEPAPEESLYPPYDYGKGYAWGLAIDLSACTGCSACTIACQAENNISVVGKEQVIDGREMHWIRIDRYFDGSLDAPAVHHQPVPCMQCENAPCEVVCPVGATNHSSEGLNDMIYNRCVGTRYCSNNCPYKVRRFNFLHYSAGMPEVEAMQRNPDVTVRYRGVMEKCTYCVQRINKGRIAAERENRRVRDGEIVPACAQVCPTDAIVFGDLNDPESEVNRWKSDRLNYQMLSGLNTRPRTSYLAKLTNPNPDLESA